MICLFIQLNYILIQIINLPHKRLDSTILDISFNPFLNRDKGLIYSPLPQQSLAKLGEIVGKKVFHWMRNNVRSCKRVVSSFQERLKGRLTTVGGGMISLKLGCPCYIGQELFTLLWVIKNEKPSAAIVGSNEIKRTFMAAS